MGNMPARGQPARRQRSFARMSEQEIQAVFAALEPRATRTLKKWACILIAAAIAAGLAFLLLARSPDRSGQAPVQMPAIDTATHLEPATLYPTEDPNFEGWESVRSFSAPAGLDVAAKPARPTRR